jgi:hypothetical protein
MAGDICQADRKRPGVVGVWGRDNARVKKIRCSLSLAPLSENLSAFRRGFF